MTLTAGSKLGPYEILAPIGAGGMGEVYRARDPRVGREVAIKVSAEKFSERFEREARAVAALNHPNICTLYDVGPDYIVMELVEGETLEDRIQQGAIPLDEALQIARQIADALEAAHEKGIIHRDLKPGNIKIRPDGTVKVLDFGLAKVAETQDTSLSNSPTLSHLATQQGIILGTAGYMSPEQARGKAVDKRADIWAFGVVLYEMLTGKRLFEGDTVSDTLAAVLKEEPGWDRIPAKAQPLLRRCLEKDPKRRLRDIGDMALLLETFPEAVPIQRPWLAWGIAAVCFLVGLGLAAALYLQPQSGIRRLIRFSVSLPEKYEKFSLGDVAVSPDGEKVAFMASDADSRSVICVHSLDRLSPLPLPGTEGAMSPFWSPDSRSLGFFSDRKLKKIEVSGGPPVTLCETDGNAFGAWSRDGIILFSFAGGLQKVSSSGGVPTPVTKLAEGEMRHVRPFFLADGRHFIFRVNYSTPGGGPLYLSSLDSSERKLLLNSDSNNVICSLGHLLFLRERTLMAQPFDLHRLELSGEAVPIAEQVQTWGATWAHGIFSASENGVLVYAAGAGTAGNRLVWFDREGKQTGVLGDPDAFQALELSPDGKRAAVIIGGKTQDIWLYDLVRNIKSRLTFDLAGIYSLIWSPDANRIVFNSRNMNNRDLYQKASNGAGTTEPVLEDRFMKTPMSWSPDGRFILYQKSDSGRADLWVLPLAGDRKPYALLKTPAQWTVGGQFSPDGRWVAFQTSESGIGEIYVSPFPATGAKWQVSTAGGKHPRWGRDGGEIFYLSRDNRMMAVSINRNGSGFDVGTPKGLFQTKATVSTLPPYDVSFDGRHFLINTASEQTPFNPFVVVLNWTAGLKK